MAKRVIAPKPRNGGTLTESAYFSKIRSLLRKGFMYWKPMQMALEKASRPYVGSNKRIKKEYQCAKCKKWHKRVDVQINHKIECGSLTCYEDIVPFIKRLTNEDVNAYEILCKPCHQKITNETRNSKKKK